MTETITAGEARQGLDRILDEVAAGKDFLIVRDGVAVARISPEAAPARTASGQRVLTAVQQTALAETLAWIHSRPAIDVGPLPTRDELYDDIMRERGLLK